MLLSVFLCARTLIFSFLFKIIWFHDFLPVIFSSYLHCLYYYYCMFVNACFVTRKVRWRIISEGASEEWTACPRLVLWLGSISSPLPFGCVARIMQILHRAPISMYNVWCFLFSEFNCFSAKALWRCLHNTPDSTAQSAYRVLGKFGGSNRKMLQEAQKVE